MRAGSGPSGSDRRGGCLTPVGPGVDGADSDRRACRDQLIQHEELRDRQRRGAMQLRADGEFAQTLGAQMADEVHATPERLLDLRSVVGSDRAGYPEAGLWPAR